MHPTLLLCCLLLGDTPLAPKPAPATFPQLIATSYPSQNQLPPDVRKPTPTHPFVDPTKLPASARVLSAAKAANGVIWIVTDQGAFRSHNNTYIPLNLPRTLGPHPAPVDSETLVVAVDSDRDGHIWAAANNGLYCTDGDRWWQHLGRRDGVPFETMTTLCLAPNGDLWGGTAEGAWRMRDGHFRYFWGRRWLPGNKVSAIWADAANRAWIETDGGIACIQEKPMTLRAKVGHFDQIVQKRHLRRGFLSEIVWKTPGDPKSSWVFQVSDNDGEWGAFQVAALSYRFAVTKNPADHKLAQQALSALLELERLSGVPGYPARAIVSDDELKNGILGVDLKEKVRVPGESDKIWFRSPVDPTIWCKGDTSSDEMDGHYYAWLLYFDLVADAEEKGKLAAVVRRVTDHIMAGGFTLIGHTGRKTRWGVWAPDLFNKDPYYDEQRPLNSLEILAYLKVAEHITGDAKYAHAYEELITRHHYLVNTLGIRRGQQSIWYSVNHADDEMILRCYFMRYLLEKAPDRRRILAQGVSRVWEDSPTEQTLRREHNPVFNFLYGVITGKPCAADEAIQALQDWPWDMMHWPVKNSARHDVTIKSGVGQAKRNELDQVLSSTERPLTRIDGNPWAADGVAFSLGYWLGVYYGFIGRER